MIKLTLILKMYYKKDSTNLRLDFHLKDCIKNIKEDKYSNWPLKLSVHEIFYTNVESFTIFYRNVELIT